jgi:hypothetical protein
MMNDKIDVLAAIDSAIAAGPHPVEFTRDGVSDFPLPHIQGLRKAHTAIAKLIDAASRAERLLREMEEAGLGDPSITDDIRAALARVGGA